MIENVEKPFMPTRGRKYGESWFLRFRSGNPTQREVCWLKLNERFRPVSAVVDVPEGFPEAPELVVAYYPFPDGTGLACWSVKPDTTATRRRPKRGVEIPSCFAAVDELGTLRSIARFTGSGSGSADGPAYLEAGTDVLPRLVNQIPRKVDSGLYAEAPILVVAHACTPDSSHDMLLGIPLDFEFLYRWLEVRENASTAPEMSSSHPILRLRDVCELTDRVLYEEDHGVEAIQPGELPTRCVVDAVWPRWPLVIGDGWWTVRWQAAEPQYETADIPTKPLERALLAAAPDELFRDVLLRMLRVGPDTALDALEHGLPESRGNPVRGSEFVASTLTRLDLILLLESPRPDVRERAQLLLPRLSS